MPLFLKKFSDNFSTRRLTVLTKGVILGLAEKNANNPAYYFV